MFRTSARIAKTYTKSRIGEQKGDFAYWQTRPYEERLAALEQIRREYHLWKYGAEPGFQRVCTIVERQ
jgi:hypothetical protein